LFVLHRMNQDTWAQLQIAERVFAYMPYRNFHVKIYQGSTTPTSTAAKKFFCSPICLLDNMSVESRFNVVKQQHEVCFRIHFYSEDVEQHVIRYLKDEMDEEVRGSQLQVIPFERVILTSSTPTVGYELSDKWIPYELDDYVWFTLNCSDEHKAAQLAQEMKQRPGQFANLRLSFSLSSQKSNRRETVIRIDSIVSGSMFTRLQQKHPEADSVLLTAEDTKQLLSESATNVLADTFDDNEIASESALYGILEKLIVSAKETITKDSSSMWDSVFWNEDNYRPDKVCRTLNEEYNKSDEDKKRKMIDSFSNETSVNYGANLSVGDLSMGTNFGTSQNQSQSSEVDNQDRLMKEGRTTAQWDGEKFIPKPMTLSRVNLSTFRNSQQFQDVKTTVSYLIATLTTTLRISESSQPQMQLGMSIFYRLCS
jgi:hypothetical protein